MGYTHYWEFIKPKRGEADKVEKLYQQAIKECRKVVQAYYKEYGGISGYTAHDKKGKYGGLCVNGRGDEMHEDFTMREHYKQNFENDGRGRDFCKTARKHYDGAVVACLAIMKYRLKDYFLVSSDGWNDDWLEGVEFAKRVLNRKIKIPDSLRTNPRYEQTLQLIGG